MWKQVPDYPNYEVSDEGRVRRASTLRPVAVVFNREGYAYVCLHRNKKRKNFRLHRLVAKVFCPNYSDDCVVHHKDTDRTNNRAENLNTLCFACHNEAHKDFEEIDVYCAKTFQLLFTCYSCAEAVNRTGVSEQAIRCSLESGTVCKERPEYFFSKF